MYILALDAALARCSAAVVLDGVVVALRQVDCPTGHAALLPLQADEVLAEARRPMLSAVAVTIGPGSFTGLRAALALAQGIGLAAGIPVIGVTVPEAFAAGMPVLPSHEIWVALDSRRAHVFLSRDGGKVVSVALDLLPHPDGPVALAGDAAASVGAALAARGADVVLTGLKLPRAQDVAAVGLRRLRGELPPVAAAPLYVDAPAARLPGSA